MKKVLLLSTFLGITPSYGQLPGRLFFTPAERISIDMSTATPAAEEHYRLDGDMKRTGGQRIYWINGQPGNLPKPELAVGDSSESPLLPANSIRIHRGKDNQ
jgi:hypothetical protein